MRLSSREVELIKDVPKTRRNRKLSAWSGLITSLVIMIGVYFFDYQVGNFGLLIAMIVGFSVGNLAAEYFRVRPDDKLVDLLLRYVNEDPTAIEQLSDQVGPMEKTL